MTDDDGDKGISDIGNGYWLIEHTGNRTFIIKIDYGDLSQELTLTRSVILDSWPPSDHASSPCGFRLSLCAFLSQFFTIESRWGRKYEPITEHILRQSAMFQYAWFQRSTLIPTDLYDESTVIAAALRCLVLIGDIDYVSANWSGYTFRSGQDFHERLSEVEIDLRKGSHPSVDVWKLPESCKWSESNPARQNSLASMLQTTLQNAQAVLLRGQAEDWPCLFYTFCILELVLSDVKNCEMWTGAFKRAAAELDSCIEEFCHMFHLSTNNFHPLSSEFDIEQYTSLVDGNELVVRHYRDLHQTWMDNSMSYLPTFGLIIDTLLI